MLENMKRLDSDRCVYSFNETETIENGGRSKEDSGHPRDPPRCLQDCREQFLDKVSAGYVDDFSKACIALTRNGPNEFLWPLYWCDSTFCGVSIDESGPLGQDRE